MRVVRIRYPTRKEDEETIDDQIGIHQKLTPATLVNSRISQRTAQGRPDRNSSKVSAATLVNSPISQRTGQVGLIFWESKLEK